MMIMTYPDGTQEFYDSGLRVRVHDHHIVASDLMIQPQAAWQPIQLEPTRVAVPPKEAPYHPYREQAPEAFRLDVSVPSQGPTSQWMKQAHDKWVEQLEGDRPFVTASADEAMAFPRRIKKAS